MITIIVFECVDVSVTLAAAWALLRLVVARPAIGWPAVAAVAAHTAPTESESVPELAAELDAPDPDGDGISWPEPTWTGLAVA